jgi:hypothetical protein
VDLSTVGPPTFVVVAATIVVVALDCFFSPGSQLSCGLQFQPYCCTIPCSPAAAAAAAAEVFNCFLFLLLLPFSFFLIGSF